MSMPERDVRHLLLSSPEHRRHPAFWPTYQAALTVILARFTKSGAHDLEHEQLQLRTQDMEAATAEADGLATIAVEHYEVEDDRAGIAAPAGVPA
jgi:hypothetical protein